MIENSNKEMDVKGTGKNAYDMLSKYISALDDYPIYDAEKYDAFKYNRLLHDALNCCDVLRQCMETYSSDTDTPVFYSEENNNFVSEYNLGDLDGFKIPVGFIKYLGDAIYDRICNDESGVKKSIDRLIANDHIRILSKDSSGNEFISYKINPEYIQSGPLFSKSEKKLIDSINSLLNKLDKYRG